MADRPVHPDIIARLAAYFHRNGYVRHVDEARRHTEGESYKKGSEIRLVAMSRMELRDIRALLRKAKFRLARPFQKAQRWCQPVYGIDAVARFLALVETREFAESSEPPEQ